MAGDWIKMRTDLDTDPAVIAIASATGLPEDTVIGKLWRVWSWANTHLRNGNARGVTETWLDKYVSCAGFARAMQATGWLNIRTDCLVFPNFERHMSKSAKQRALTSVRVAQNRNAASVTKALPEKRREEKSNKTPQPPELDASAKAVVAHYQAVVKPDHATSRGKENVLSLFKKGHTEEALKRAADGYAAQCAEKNREPKYRVAVGNFYGKAATFEEFLAWQPQTAPAPMTDEERLAYSRQKYGQPITAASTSGKSTASDCSATERPALSPNA